MKLDHIDIDSWGKKTEKPKTEIKTIIKSTTAKPKPKPRPRSKPKRQLTALDLGRRIQKSDLGITGEKAFKKWIMRNKKLDIATLQYILYVLQDMKKEGYEI